MAPSRINFFYVSSPTRTVDGLAVIECWGVQCNVMSGMVEQYLNDALPEIRRPFGAPWITFSV